MYVLAVCNLDRSAEFYTDIMGGELIHREQDLFAQVSLGDHLVRLVSKSRCPGGDHKREALRFEIGDIVRRYRYCHMKSVPIRRWVDFDCNKILEVSDPDGHTVILTQSGVEAGK